MAAASGMYTASMQSVPHTRTDELAIGIEWKSDMPTMIRSHPIPANTFSSGGIQMKVSNRLADSIDAHAANSANAVEARRLRTCEAPRYSK